MKRWLHWRALEDGRELPAAAIDLGALLLERGKAREAQKSFERAQSLAAGHVDVHYGLAKALVAAGTMARRARGSSAASSWTGAWPGRAVSIRAASPQEGKVDLGPPPVRGRQRRAHWADAPRVRRGLRELGILRAPRPPTARRSS
jgi:hypothetical protein